MWIPSKYFVAILCYDDDKLTGALRMHLKKIIISLSSAEILSPIAIGIGSKAGQFIYQKAGGKKKFLPSHKTMFSKYNNKTNRPSALKRFKSFTVINKFTFSL